MTATPRAEQLVPLIREALELLDQSLVPEAEFNPAEIDRYHRDAGNVWLRGVAYEAATSLPLPNVVPRPRTSATETRG